MNTSHTSTLTAEQLEAFLEGKLSPEETARVQHLLDDCELSKEALEGYTIVPGAFADVDALKKSIAKKSGMTSMNWSTIGLGIVAIAALSIFLTIFLGEDPKPDTPVVQTDVITSELDAPPAPAPANILIPAEDHFVNPEANTKQITMAKNTDETGDTTMTDSYSTEALLPIPVDQQPVLIADTTPVKTVVSEASYNAQVGFLLDLKITEFDKYYLTETIEVRELPLTGTSADKENKDDVGDPTEVETIRSVPADQFLREGLIAFRDARYGKCISKMDVLLKNNPNDINALFYSAISYVKLEMYSKAIPLLDKIIADPNNVFDEEAEWYKAIALEGNGESAAAQTVFKSIADKGGFYSKQASAKLR
jgi:hypothetical protein